MRLKVVIVWAPLAAAAGTPIALAELKVTADTPRGSILLADPADVDVSDMPLDAVEDLHLTGTAPKVDISAWRLVLDGTGLGRQLSLSYEELTKMPTVIGSPILICPGFFADHAQWEGVPLSALLAQAMAKNTWKTMTFVSIDGYQSRFTRQEVDSHSLYLAFKVNGRTLPLVHGYPVRLVAEKLAGGRWVKWIRQIQVE